MVIVLLNFWTVGSNSLTSKTLLEAFGLTGVLHSQDASDLLRSLAL